MKIGILSRNIELYSTQRLIDAGRARGHEVQIIDTLRCYMNISSNKPIIHYKGKELKNFDAIIPRIGASITIYGTAVLRQFEMMGVYVANSSLAITRARDKLRSLQLLSRKNIDLPVTAYAHDFDDINHVIKIVGGAPLIIKVLEGTQGIGVVLAESNGVAESVLQAFLGLRVNILAQEYIKEAEGADLRCLVIDKKVVAAMKRQAMPGEFRSNLHRGGTATPITLTAKEKKIAVAAAQILGLNIAGVDILRSKRGPLVMEVNASPGLEGIETSTNKDIATMVIELLEKNAGRKNLKALVQ